MKVITQKSAVTEVNFLISRGAFILSSLFFLIIMSVCNIYIYSYYFLHKHQRINNGTCNLTKCSQQKKVLKRSRLDLLSQIRGYMVRTDNNQAEDGIDGHIQ